MIALETLEREENICLFAIGSVQRDTVGFDSFGFEPEKRLAGAAGVEVGVSLALELGFNAFFEIKSVALLA